MSPRTAKRARGPPAQQTPDTPQDGKRRSSKRVAAARAAKPIYEDITEEEAVSMFNELSRADLEALFRKIYNQSADTAHLLTLERVDSKRRKLGDGPTEKQRATRSLGAFGVLPNELLAEIFSYLTTREFIVLTSEVSKGLCDYRWLRPAWEKIDTSEIPYNHLLSVILPQINSNVPGVIKHAKVVYKQNFTPKIEKFLFSLAARHTLKSLHICQPHGIMTVKRLEVLQKLVREHKNMQEIVEFVLRVGEKGLHYRDNVIRNAEMALELAAYWPQLQRITLDVPGGLNECLSMKSFRILADAGCEVKPGLRANAHNYITSISLVGGVEITPEIIVKLGQYFPEIQRFKAEHVGPGDSLETAFKLCHDGYNFAEPLPRLEQFEATFSFRMDHRPTHALSTLFFSILHRAPNLLYMSYKTNSFHGDKIRLFEAIRKWRGGWRGTGHDKLQTLKLRAFALEWKLLSHKGMTCEFPALTNMDGTDCINIERDLVRLMKRGGRS